MKRRIAVCLMVALVVGMILPATAFAEGNAGAVADAQQALINPENNPEISQAYTSFSEWCSIWSAG